MATPYSILFQSFLGKIESDIYARMTQVEAEEDMIVLLNSGIVNFDYPKVDVFDKSDSEQAFNQDVGFKEIEMIAHLMKMEWLKRQIFSINIIKQKLSTSDFRLTSQAAHLDALLKLKADAENDFNIAKNKYSYSKNNAPDYSGLSGEG